MKSHLPADRLLVWDVREGWEPLCKFLYFHFIYISYLGEIPRASWPAAGVGRAWGLGTTLQVPLITLYLCYIFRWNPTCHLTACWCGTCVRGGNHSASSFNYTISMFPIQVKSHVPADRLLVWDVREGWEPLCKFLQVPVPNKPFPRYVNLCPKNGIMEKLRFL
jgi:Sulfotransferase domain